MKSPLETVQLVSLALCATLLLATTSACGRREQTEPPARVAGVDVSGRSLHLGGFAEVAGTEFLVAPLVPRSSSLSYGSDGRTGAKDLLFFHVATKKAHWLLGDSKRRLRFYAFIVNPPLANAWVAPDDDAAERETLCVLFESVPDPADTKQTSTRASIGLAAPDGSAADVMIDGVSGYFGHHLVGDHSLLVFYSRDGELWAADIDPAARTIRADTRVSTAPEPAP